MRNLLPLAALIFCLGVVYLPGCDTLITEVNEFTIAGHPTAEFGIDSLSVDSGCTPLTVGYVDKSTGPHQSWLWRFGDGDSSLDTNPVHTYEEAGTYTVTLTITDTTVDDEPGGDIEVKNRFIIVGTSIDSFSADIDTACPGQEITFAPISYGGIASYSWNFGDSSSLVGDSNPTHTYDSAGTYACTLTVTGGCGTKIIGYDSLIIINACPVARIVADTLYGCSPLSVDFDDSTDYRGVDKDSVIWWITSADTAVTSGREDGTFSYEFATPGKYVIWVDVYSEGGTATDTLDDTIFVWNAPKVKIFANGSIGQIYGCLDSLWQFYVDFEAVFDDTIDDRMYTRLEWDFGDGYFSNPDDSMPIKVSHAYLVPGAYSVILRSWGPCSDSIGLVESVLEMVCVSWPWDTKSAGFTIGPDADSAAVGIQGDTSTVFNFADTTGVAGLTWTWDFGDGQTDTLQNVTHQYTTTGTKIVTLTLANCCNDTTITDSIVIDTMGAFESFRRYRDPSVKR